jgi:hypothetical protein
LRVADEIETDEAGDVVTVGAVTGSEAVVKV